MIEHLLGYSEYIFASGMAGCGWLLASVRRREARVNKVEESIESIENKLDKEIAVQGARIQEIRGDVREISSTVKILLKSQLTR